MTMTCPQTNLTKHVAVRSESAMMCRVFQLTTVERWENHTRLCFRTVRDDHFGQPGWVVYHHIIHSGSRSLARLGECTGYMDAATARTVYGARE